ncbi:MAG: GHMP kinase [Methanobacteriaceae archaeon]|nr:GHMP kinase [Methanobacteriaceae archaeon]
MKCTVFVPSHITGFFEIVEHHNPLIKGSRGAGVTLNRGVISQVNVTDGNGEIIIKTNGSNYPLEGSVSYKTLDLLRKQFPEEIRWDEKKITIHHQTQVPIEAGFGVSAGSALGTSMSLSKLLKLPLTYNQAAAVAHRAEVELNTGLGDVMGAVMGGFPIRLEPGAPGFGKADRLLDDKVTVKGYEKDFKDINFEDIKYKSIGKDGGELYVISKSLGTIETSSVLKSPEMTRRVNKVARELLGKLISSPQISNFMDLSLEFAQKTGLIDEEVMEIVEVMKEETIGASMAMLGKTAFSISQTPDSSVEGVMVAKVDSCGCRFF